MEDLFHRCPGAQGLGQSNGPLNEEGALTVSVRTPSEFPGSSDANVLSAGYLGQDAFSRLDFANSARSVNACGSLTASSARILRSTSTSARRSPAISFE